MKPTLFPLLSALCVLSACSRQNISREAGAPLTAIVKGDTVPELGSNIMSVYQDRKNNYWFGSWESGLYKYDGKIILHYSTKNGLPDNRVEEIQEDKSGNIFFNTSAGPCKFDGREFSLLQVRENGEWALQTDDLWFKSLQFDGKIYRYDGQTLHSLQFPGFEPGKTWTPYGVYTIYKDSQGNIWFGTAVLGACRYNGVAFDWISEEDVTELHNGPSNGVRSIIEDKDGYFRPAWCFHRAES